ncbi:radical SAM protein [Bacteroides cellulosilyticus]|uniref:radical SAM protein n=1 Tax=Bacteroides cellulosilyticus TaxID=246787 RepID=UPI001899457F|nr:radical SAM protein [Bacteroides cellulosilyticus]
MSKEIEWKRFRVLVTGKCNYRCPFCHNEGQEKQGHTSNMSLDEFKLLIDYLRDKSFVELAISGGEPFVHPQIVEMIEYACQNLTCDVSCATNLSLIKPEQIYRLSKTRVKFNIQYPYTDRDKFSKSTGIGDIDLINRNINFVKDAGLEIGLNTVIQTADTEALSKLLTFVLENQLPLKLLPQIGNDNSKKYREWVFPMIRHFVSSERNKGTGAIRWEITNGQNNTSVLYIDSPCFSNDIETCRNFGELRIHPGLRLQTCISGSLTDALDFSKGDSAITTKLVELWNTFTTC